MTEQVPRFSFLMICYKQEKFIKQAIESALSQTEPIELVISDDNSPDRTFDIAVETVSHYHGPHQIILHRNPTNLGVGANFCKAAELAHGEWLFMAAGDDVSLPDRTAKIKDAIPRYPHALAFGAPRILIDAAGNIVGYSNWNRILHGSSAVWHRSIFSKFPKLPQQLNAEDTVLYLRVFLLGGEVVLLKDPLVKWRIVGITHRTKKESYLDHIRQTLALREIVKKSLVIRLSDCEIPNLPISEEDLEKIKQHQRERLKSIEKKITALQLRISCLEKGFFGFWKAYFTNTLTVRPPIWMLPKISFLFFKRARLFQPPAETPSYQEITITVDRYLNENSWDI